MIIMTSNVWGYYFGNTVEGRDRGLADVFGKYGPDVLGLQEMTPSFYGSELTGRLREGYRILGAPGNCTPLAFRRSFSLADWGFEQLRDTPDRDKSVTWAVLNDPETGKTFGACSTHFWWPEDEEAERIRLKNAEQLADLMTRLHREYGCPVFAFGDMNCTLSSGVFGVYEKAGIRHLWREAEQRDDRSSMHGDPLPGEDGAFHGKRTADGFERSLDHIVALGDGFAVERYSVIEDREVLDATDHSPELAVIRWL